MDDECPSCRERHVVFEDATYLITETPGLLVNGFNVYLKDVEAGIATKIHDEMTFFLTYEAAKAFAEAHRTGSPATPRVIRIVVSEPGETSD